MLPVSNLNHISIVVTDTEDSANFYKNVLGFSEVKRPSAFEFEGCWLKKGNTALHLIEGSPDRPQQPQIDPKSDHISFVSRAPMKTIEDTLGSMNIPFIKEKTREGDTTLEQVFFHDPDCMMIEVCNCDTLPVCYVDDARSAARESRRGACHGASNDERSTGSSCFSNLSSY